ncbi:LacI family DNA-binding transcriptional regulator [Edaphovirga cremea]|uniref:LacI family DNA-binding transcriptional regulator n=1 Tax=Edaphovirga cremea TaxID=2267246 RepID=UPI000DEEC864|nr:LacI family DNA-binding transcriptional regulator [Edaphovirga cremea]
MSRNEGAGVSGRATISDVARTARTGKTSVSRYLNGEQNLLSDDLKQRIEDAIRTLDYRPSQMARSLKGGQTRLIGLIIADITNPYSVDILRGVEAACREHGFTLLVCNTNNEVNQEQHYLQLLSSYRVEGIVVNAVGMREEALSMLQQSSLPMVLIDRKIPGFACDVVGLNNQEAATLATEHLIQQGFEAILFLSEPIGSVNTRLERLHAFQRTMQQHADLLAAHDEVTLNNNQKLEQQLSDFNRRHRGMRKAVLSANGALTLQIARAMRRLGIRWGNDIGLLGFDELEWAELAGVGITTLKQPTYEMGFSALEQLLKRIQGAQEPVSEQAFSGELIIRGSTSLQPH